VEINSKAGRSAEKWEEAEKNVGTNILRTVYKSDKPKDKFQVKKTFQKREGHFTERIFLNRRDNSNVKTFATQTE